MTSVHLQWLQDFQWVDAESAVDPDCNADSMHPNEVVKELQTKLLKQSDMVVDFSSLQTCLNPMAIGDPEKASYMHAW